MKNIVQKSKELLSIYKEIGFIKSATLLFNIVFYRLQYIEDGYYLTKRVWLWILLMPIIFPIFFLIPALLKSLPEYIIFCTEYWSKRIVKDERKLSTIEKISFRMTLWN